MNFNLIRSGSTESYSRSLGDLMRCLGMFLDWLVSLIAACSGCNKWAVKKYMLRI